MVGFEGVYEVSSFGRVRSVNRIDPAGHRRQEHMLALQLDKHGYPVVHLRLNGRDYMKKVHQLVARAFIGPPTGHVQINHKDGVKTNAHVENLEWCTAQQNITHAVQNGLHANTAGSRNGRAKLTEAQVAEIRRLYAVGDTSCPRLARQFGVGKSTIGYIVQNATWVGAH